MHALHRGSRFAQVRLFMQLVLPCPQADPWRVALRKGWHACSLVRHQGGEESFWKTWAGTSKDGPLLSFKKLLLQLPRTAQGGSRGGQGRQFGRRIPCRGPGLVQQEWCVAAAG